MLFSPFVFCLLPIAAAIRAPVFRQSVRLSQGSRPFRGKAAGKRDARGIAPPPSLLFRSDENKTVSFRPAFLRRRDAFLTAFSGAFPKDPRRAAEPLCSRFAAALQPFRRHKIPFGASPVFFSRFRKTSLNRTVFLCPSDVFFSALFFRWR